MFTCVDDAQWESAGQALANRRHPSPRSRTPCDGQEAEPSFSEARGFVLGKITIEQVDDISVEVWELSRDI